MKTPAVVHLPRPPDIIGASCPDDRAREINYLADYLWKRNWMFYYPFFSIFLDLYYGHCLFPYKDKTVKDGELSLDKTFDDGELRYNEAGTGLTINIEGTEYDSSVGIYYLTYNDLYANTIYRRGYDCPPGQSAADACDVWANSPIWTVGTVSKWIVVWNRIQIYGTIPAGICNGSVTGAVATSQKAFAKFDTQPADASPTSALISLYLDANNIVGGETVEFRIYEQDFGDEVDTGDWTGGDLIATREFGSQSVDPREERYEISIPVENVNIGGYSKYKFTLKIVDDGTSPCDTAAGLTFENAQLKLGYNE